jgi:hypothetical protein
MQVMHIREEDGMRYSWDRVRQFLVAAGCPVDPKPFGTAFGEDWLVVRPNGYYTNRIFQVFPTGGTGYALDVMISNPSSKPQTICEIVPTPPWADPDFTWLEDPKELTPNRNDYVFPGNFSYPREEVLNHRICEGGRVPARGLLRGLLLGWSKHPIPERYRHGSTVSVKLEMLDHALRAHEFEFPVYVDRSEKLLQNPKRKHDPDKRLETRVADGREGFSAIPSEHRAPRSVVRETERGLLTPRGDAEC